MDRCNLSSFFDHTLCIYGGSLTSPLIGPSTMDAISLITSTKSLPSFAIREGLVVTPQITPMSFAFLMSSTFAVSIKKRITLLLFAM